MTDAVALYAEGRLPAGVAIARLILDGSSTEDIRHRFATSGIASDHLGPIFSLLRPDRLQAMRDMVSAAALDHSGLATPHDIAAAFDRAAEIAPEMGAALYCLGIDGLLGDATNEIVTFLAANGCLAPNIDALDLGCGTGRLTTALSHHVRSILGIDVSSAMLRAAECKSQDKPNVRYQRADGFGLQAFPDDSFDLVLAIDTFPYLVQAGVAEVHILESRRVLRPAGSLLICNLSYRSDTGRDEADLQAWSHKAGFALSSCGVPFRLWDAKVWLLRCI